MLCAATMFGLVGALPDSQEASALLQASRQVEIGASSDLLSVKQAPLAPPPVYKNSQKQHKFLCEAGNAAFQMYSGDFASPQAYEVFKKYDVTKEGDHWTGAGDRDSAWFFRKQGRCLISFMGSDSISDFANNYNFTPIAKWGFEGVHAGVAAELESLVEQMKSDFVTMQQECHYLTVTGHSLGGALAQLFSLVINKDGDPLNAGLTVNKLFTFGAMSAVNFEEGRNDKRKDGCFKGGQFYYAEHFEERDTWYLDVAANPGVTGGVHDPVRSNKRLVGPEGEVKNFKCGTKMQGESLFFRECTKPGSGCDCQTGNGCDAYWGKHSSYPHLLGCMRLGIGPGGL